MIEISEIAVNLVLAYFIVSTFGVWPYIVVSGIISLVALLSQMHKEHHKENKLKLEDNQLDFDEVSSEEIRDLLKNEKFCELRQKLSPKAEKIMEVMVEFTEDDWEQGKKEIEKLIEEFGQTNDNCAESSINNLQERF